MGHNMYAKVISARVPPMFLYTISINKLLIFVEIADLLYGVNAI